jgi:predicted AlkP superfamily pyrophosphatase or phosphodiesterase
VQAQRLTPVVPTVTWPCHTSIVTGVSPARHGVLGNMVFDRASGDEAHAELASQALAARLLRERHPA